MSRKERIKAKLDLLKVLIVAVLTALFGVFGFCALHYKELDFIIGVAAAVSVVVLIGALCYLGFDFNKELDKLEAEE